MVSACEPGAKPSVAAPPVESGLAFVTDGTAGGTIILADEANDSISDAAEIFARTVREATGASLPIIPESEAGTLLADHPRLYLGPTAAARAEGLDVSQLPLETYRILAKGNAVFVVGNDESESDTKTVSRPTLWALNEVLEKQLGVRWLWPGDLGTYIPKKSDFVIPSFDVTYQPSLLIRSLRLNISKNRRLAAAEAQRDGRLKQEALLWAENHQAGQRGDIKFGHAFGHWWDRYSKDHPDYFAELPDGVAAPFPNADRVKLRLANPAVIEQIAQEYEAAGKPQYWNVCPNDGGGFDISEATRAWDIPAGQSIDDIFTARANLTARYVEFWNRLHQRLVQVNPDVVLTTYAYSAYRYPPPPQRPLTARAVLAIVDTYNAYDAWRAWSANGTELVLRPNWWHQGGDAPYLPLRKTAEYLKFAAQNGMVGLDMDSINGYWATQGINYYLAARLMTNPDLSLESVLDEYSSAFGKGAPKIKDYLAYWQIITDEYNYPLNAASEDAANVPSRYQELVRQKKVPASILNGSKYALPYLYKDEVIAPALQLLDQAEKLIGDSDELASKRVEFLRQGLRSLQATRDQIALGQKLKERPTEKIKEEFVKGSAALDTLREELSADHAIWAESIAWHENRYKVLIRPANVGHHEINLDGM
jgi:hypothetical protein